jgi:hypothetical protein
VTTVGKGGLFIDPPSARLLEDRFFELSTGKFHSTLVPCLGYLRDRLAEQGIVMHTADRLPPPSRGTRHLYVSVGNHQNHARLARRDDVVLGAFMITESPIVEPRIFRGLRSAKDRFQRIYSCIDGPAITEYVGTQVDCIPLRWPIDVRGVDEPLWSRTDRRFLVMINMNKLPRLQSRELFTERMRAVEFLSRTGDIDLYGIGWNEPSMRMGRSRLPGFVQRGRRSLQRAWDRLHPDPLLVAARKVYKGELRTKWDVLASYDFVLCFENTEIKGWLTEKLFDALRVGTIPIYWGATDIEELVPPEAFIDMRQFSGYGELLVFLRSLGPDDKRRYRTAARDFLTGPSFEPFSREAFASIFTDMLDAYLGIRVSA